MDTNLYRLLIGTGDGDGAKAGHMDILTLDTIGGDGVPIIITSTALCKIK